jgi:hypothetical protein
MKHNKLNYSLLTLLILFSLSISFHASAEEDNSKRSVKPLDGELILPDDYNKGEEKKCVTVCDKWGEDCILNPSTGSRKCRRVCKSFAEQCF